MTHEHAKQLDESRRRVVMSAYACGPGPEFGSEPGAGWAFAEAAARGNEVWVFTRMRFRNAITDRLRQDTELARWLHPIYVSLSDELERRKRRPVDVYWYYVLWQRRVAALARTLHDEQRFDVGHHVTFASDWLPAGILELEALPTVWGPVGGATRLPPALLRFLGPRGAAGELMRTAVTGVGRRVWGERAARRAQVVVGLNHDVERRFSRIARSIDVEPNSAILLPLGDVGAPTPDSRAVFAGRLVPWKGCALAIEALATQRLQSWTLDVYGEGPDEGRLRKLAQRRGLEPRVIFHGQRPRDEILAAFQRADVLLFPSMHDSAPWVVAEAVSLGCPVVCLDVGGPPILMDGYGVAVPIDGDVVGELVNALDSLGGRFEPSSRWAPERLARLTNSWYDDAVRLSQSPRL